MKSAPPIPDEQAALLAAIVAGPDEDTPRLVYADWLEEHDDENGAKYIRLAIQLEHEPDRKSGSLLGALELIARRAWLERIGSDVDRVEFKRGFPDWVGFFGPTPFLRSAAVVFASAPIRGVCVDCDHGTEVGASVLRQIAAVPELARLSSFGLRNVQGCTTEGWRAFFGLAAFWELKHLSLGGCQLTEPEVQALAETPMLAQLEELELRRNDIGYFGARAILDSPYLKRLAKLDVVGNFRGFGLGEAEAIEALQQRFGSGVRIEE